MVIESFPTIRAPFAILTLIEKHVEKNRFVLKVKKKIMKNCNSNLKLELQKILFSLYSCCVLKFKTS